MNLFVIEVCSVTEYISADTERRRFHSLSSHRASWPEASEHTHHCRRMCETGRLWSCTHLCFLHGTYFRGSYIADDIIHSHYCSSINRWFIWYCSQWL